MSWIDQRTRGAQGRVVTYLPSSRPKCQANVNLYGFDAERAQAERPDPKGKRCTIALGPVAKSMDIRSDAQQRAIVYSERWHKLQRLDAKAGDMESRSPERCQQTSITSIAHKDLFAGGIEAVLRRSGADGGGGSTVGRNATTSNNNNSANNTQQQQQPLRSAPNASSGRTAMEYDDDDVPPLEVLAAEGWAKPRIDAEKLRDPYLRQQGLHINDAGVYSHISKQLVSSRSLTKAIVDKSVDFNFQYVQKK